MVRKTEQNTLSQCHYALHERTLSKWHGSSCDAYVPSEWIITLNILNTATTKGNSVVFEMSSQGKQMSCSGSRNNQ